MASPLSLRVDVDMSELIRAARDAGYSVESLGDDFRDVERDSDSASRGVIRDLDDVDRAADTTSTSVSGSLGGAFSDVGSIAQDALAGDAAGAVEGLASSVSGVAGAIPGIGTAIAVAGGLVAAGFQLMQADAEATQARVDDMYTDMVNGASNALSQTYLLAQAQELIGDPTRLAQAQAYADLLGTDLNTVIGALVGDTTDLANVQDVLAQKIENAGSKVQGFSVTQGEAATRSQELFSKLSEARSTFDGTDAAVARAADAYRAYSDYASDLTGTTEDASGAVSDLSDQLSTFPTDVDSRLKVTVDDSAVRAWHPPLLQIPAQVVVRPGQVQYTG